MSAPARPEREIIEAQSERLRAILGPDDWHTTAGAAVYFEPPGDDARPLHIHLAGVEVTPESRRGVVIAVEWRARVPLSGHADLAAHGDLAAYDVLADMRAALICGHTDTRVESANVTMREAGSNYAVVSVTAAVHRPVN